MAMQRVHMETFPMWHHAQPPSLSLHTQGPSQCPRVDKLHLPSVAGTRPAVAGSTRKDVAQVVWNCPGVADAVCHCDWDKRKLSKDNLYGDDIENGLSVVTRIHNPRANRFQSSCNIGIMSMIAMIKMIDLLKHMICLIV
jgi:hypothetical protein